MPRNAAGAYTLPAGNPVVSATQITIAWANGTMSDLATEVQASLDRNGRGAMLAPLKLYNGILAAPGLAFADETNTGIGKFVANEVSMVIAGVLCGKFTSAGWVGPVVGNASSATTAGACTGNAATATSAAATVAALTAGSYLTSAGTFNGAVARTFAVDATSANTASKVVARDANGDFAMRGLSLGNTAVAGNVLDWYEEGTWVPTVTGIGAPVMGNQDGKYTRIGNVLHFMISLSWTGGTNAAAISGITGLPFAPAGFLQNVPIMLNWAGGTFTFSGVPVAYANGGTTLLVGVISSVSTIATLNNQNAGTKELFIQGSILLA